jgi:hypothetical protein
MARCYAGRGVTNLMPKRHKVTLWTYCHSFYISLHIRIRKRQRRQYNKYVGLAKFVSTSQSGSVVGPSWAFDNFRAVFFRAHSPPGQNFTASTGAMAGPRDVSVGTPECNVKDEVKCSVAPLWLVMGLVWKIFRGEASCIQTVTTLVAVIGFVWIITWDVLQGSSNVTHTLKLPRFPWSHVRVADVSMGTPRCNVKDDVRTSIEVKISVAPLGLVMWLVWKIYRCVASCNQTSPPLVVVIVFVWIISLGVASCIKYQPRPPMGQHCLLSQVTISMNVVTDIAAAQWRFDVTTFCIS